MDVTQSTAAKMMEDSHFIIFFLRNLSSTSMFVGIPLVNFERVQMEQLPSRKIDAKLSEPPEPFWV